MAACSWSCPMMGCGFITIIYLHWWGTLLRSWSFQLWLLRVPECQYSAVYSVPWSPLHSSVNSFTISFTLLLFTRSLQDRGYAHFLLCIEETLTASAKRCSHLVLPEYLLWEVVFLLYCDPWWREPWRLQRLLQPHTKQREAVLVQAEQHFCELVHETPRSPTPNALLAAGWSGQVRRRKWGGSPLKVFQYTHPLVGGLRKGISSTFLNLFWKD